MSTYLVLTAIKASKIDPSQPLNRQMRVMEISEGFQCTHLVRQVIPQVTVVTEDGTCGDLVKPFQEDAEYVLSDLLQVVANVLTDPSLTMNNAAHLSWLSTILHTAQILRNTGYVVCLSYS